MAHQIKPAGRLGEPEMSLRSDPRTNVNLAKALRPLGLDINIPPNKINATTASMAEVKKMMKKVNDMDDQTTDMMPRDLPSDKTRPKVNRKDITIKGVDGNDVKLHVYRRADSEGVKLPCVVYIHGGGLSRRTISTIFRQIADDLQAWW
jgi:acetyl esterase/lipase